MKRLNFRTHGWAAVAAAATFLWAAPAVSAQAADVSFFVMVEGAGYGADQPALRVSDSHCGTVAYAAGLGDGRWRAYLNGSAAEGEGDQVGRERIGTGPWVNYWGYVIAEDVAQLHSDGNNLNVETALTVTGEYPPAGALQLPMGSELDAASFSRSGPYFCFKLPG
jgi:hypothetical protein